MTTSRSNKARRGTGANLRAGEVPCSRPVHVSALVADIGGTRARFAIAEGGRTALAGATMAVLGPGTGLGVAGLLRCGAGWFAVSGEGGHATLAPGDEHESEILKLARRHPAAPGRAARPFSLPCPL